MAIVTKQHSACESDSTAVTSIMIGGGGSQIYPLIRCWPYFKRRGRFVTRKSETIMPGKLRGKGAFINVSAVR